MDLFIIMKLKGKKLKRANEVHYSKKRYQPVDNKLVIILIIVGIFALLIGISFLTNNTQEEKKEISQTTTTIIQRPLTCEEGCKSDTTCINNCKVTEINKIVAKKDVNVKECDVIKDSRLKETCIENIILKEASTKLDETYCNNIKDPVKSSNCRDNIILNKAILNKDKTLCNQIIVLTVKDLCIKNIK